MEELKWKYLIRSSGLNIMMIGPSGCGKTMIDEVIGKRYLMNEFLFQPWGFSRSGYINR